MEIDTYSCITDDNVLMSRKSNWNNHMVFCHCDKYGRRYMLVNLCYSSSECGGPKCSAMRSSQRIKSTVEESPPPLLCTWWNTLSASAWDAGKFPNYRHQVYPAEMHWPTHHWCPELLQLKPAMHRCSVLATSDFGSCHCPSPLPIFPASGPFLFISFSLHMHS